MVATEVGVSAVMGRSLLIPASWAGHIPESGVAAAWRATARSLPVVRAVFRRRATACRASLGTGWKPCSWAGSTIDVPGQPAGTGGDRRIHLDARQVQRVATGIHQAIARAEGEAVAKPTEGGAQAGLRGGVVRAWQNTGRGGAMLLELAVGAAETVLGAKACRWVRLLSAQAEAKQAAVFQAADPLPVASAVRCGNRAGRVRGLLRGRVEAFQLRAGGGRGCGCDAGRRRCVRTPP